MKVITDLAGLTVTKLLQKNPVISLVTVASELATALTDIDEKAELDVLNMYREALYCCMGAVNSLFEYGKTTSDVSELYFFSSMYLGMVKRSNEIAKDIVCDLIDGIGVDIDETLKTEMMNDYQKGLEVLSDNIALIESLQRKVINRQNNA